MKKPDAEYKFGNVTVRIFGPRELSPERQKMIAKAAQPLVSKILEANKA